jgi:hypothetical protein
MSNEIRDEIFIRCSFLRFWSSIAWFELPHGQIFHHTLKGADTIESLRPIIATKLNVRDLDCVQFRTASGVLAKHAQLAFLESPISVTFLGKLSFRLSGACFIGYFPHDLTFHDTLRCVKEKLNIEGVCLKSAASPHKMIKPADWTTLSGDTEFLIASVTLHLRDSRMIRMTYNGSDRFDMLDRTRFSDVTSPVFIKNEGELSGTAEVDDHSDVFGASPSIVLTATVSTDRDRSIHLTETAIFSDIGRELKLSAGELLVDRQDRPYSNGRPICSVLFSDPSAKVYVRSPRWLFKLVQPTVTTDVYLRLGP